MTSISLESIILIRSFLRDHKIEQFYNTQLTHDTSDIEHAINTWNSSKRQEIETIFAQLLQEFKIKRQSPDSWYLFSALIDRSSYFK